MSTTRLDESQVVAIDAVADGLLEPFRQVDLVTANDTVVRIARLEGEFPWHAHEEDELFLCWRGTFRVEQEGGDAAILQPGQLVVVPKGMRHRPVADTGPAYTLLIERTTTTQYGDTDERLAR